MQACKYCQIHKSEIFFAPNCKSNPRESSHYFSEYQSDKDTTAEYIKHQRDEVKVLEKRCDIHQCEQVSMSNDLGEAMRSIELLKKWTKVVGLMSDRIKELEKWQNDRSPSPKYEVPSSPDWLPGESPMPKSQECIHSWNTDIYSNEEGKISRSRCLWCNMVKDEVK